MIVTTSRKPSRRTRSFAKAFSRFLNWKYVQRGKMSLKDLRTDQLCMISEIKGNPAVMNFFLDGIKRYELFFTVSNVKKVEMGDEPVLYIGEKYNLFQAVPKSLIEKFDKRPYFDKVIVEKGEDLFFYFKKQLIFKMRILKFRQIR